jgi:putative hydrolase of the HAD superfamily
MSYRHLFFDLDDTLWDFQANADEALREVFDKYRLERYFDDFEHFFHLYTERNLELWELYRQGKIKKAELNRERFFYPLKQVGLHNDELALSFGNDFLRICPSKTHLVQGAREVLKYLSDKHYTLSIISNGFSELQHDKLRNTGIAEFFDKVFLSESVGRHKPHRDIFDYAVKSSNARKTQSLMIGDNWEADIVGARLAGIDQAFFGKAFEWDKPPTFQVNFLEELKEFL